ncbi:MAG: 30S ribosomal protein S7 [Nanoarchaeota archaeon]|nr:30S ribosomal protein S7 [Nanoarchaeota archaeon]
MADILAFNRWSMEGIHVSDPGLKNYISLDCRIVNRTGARFAKYRFHKSKVFIIERLMNKMMNPGHKAKKHKISSRHCTGKGTSVNKIMIDVLENIENKTKKNPIEVVIKAIENAAPREEIITIEYGGAKYPKAVECAPQRRVDMALRLMTQGAYQKSFNSRRSIVQTLSDELINAYNLSTQSAAIAKKLELERQSDSSR